MKKMDKKNKQERFRLKKTGSKNRLESKQMKNSEYDGCISSKHRITRTFINQTKPLEKVEK